METKREFKRTYLKYGKFLDPIAVFALIILIVIPIFAVINLSTKTLPSIYEANTTNNDKNVLGAKSDNTFGLELTPGGHAVIQTKLLNKVNVNRYIYKTNILKHNFGTYSRPVLNIYNNTDLPILVSISPSGITEQPLVNTILDSSRKRLYSTSTGLRLVTYTVQPHMQKDLYVEIFSRKNINFQEELSLDIYLSVSE